MEEANKSHMFKGLLIVLAFMIFAFVFPRILIATLGEGNPWTNYLYLYGFGAIYFGAGMLLIRKTGACKAGRGYDDFWWKVMWAGFIFFASLHAFWIYLSLSIPFKGGI